MDGWLKGLIAAACIAVIAASGVYLFGQASAYSAHSAQQGEISEAQAELFARAHANPGEIGKVKDFCKLNQKVLANIKDNPIANRVDTNCRAFGYL